MADPDPDRPVRRLRHLPVPRSDQPRAKAGCAGSARRTRPSARPPTSCPSRPSTGPAYLASMATLNYNLGSLPLQDGNLVDLIPDYRDAINAMTAEVETATTTVEVEFYIAAWDEVTAPFFEALVAAVGARCEGAAAHRPHGLAQHPRVHRVREAGSTAAGIDWRPMLPGPPAQGAVPAAGPAQPPQAPRRRRADRPSWARRTSSSRATTRPKNHKGGPGVRRARRAHRRARRSTRCGRSSRRTGTPRPTSAWARTIAPVTPCPPRRRRRRAGAPERAGLRHREQPAPLHGPDLLGAEADLGDQPVLRPRRAAAVRRDHRRPAGRRRSSSS